MKKKKPTLRTIKNQMSVIRKEQKQFTREMFYEIDALKRVTTVVYEGLIALRGLEIKSTMSLCRRLDVIKAIMDSKHE